MNPIYYPRPPSNIHVNFILPFRHVLTSHSDFPTGVFFYEVVPSVVRAKLLTPPFVLVLSL